jgi:hypothetical protein
VAADSIRVDEWLAELEKLSRRSVDGFSVKELADSTGHSLLWSRNVIKAGMARGLVEYAGKKSAVRMDGGACLVPVYRSKRGAKSRGRR